MELIIAVIGIGICVSLNVVGLWLIVKALSTQSEMLLSGILGTVKVLSREIAAEHKKTRKETQEIKTRLTQVRKDLNKIERKR